MQTRQNHIEYMQRAISSFYVSFCTQERWFTHRWHHGDHSYFYWLVSSQLFSVLCHLSNRHQSTSPREKKKSSTQKWLRVERRNMIHACHATVLGVFHKSDVLSLLLVCHPCLHLLFTHWVKSGLYPIIQHLSTLLYLWSNGFSHSFWTVIHAVCILHVIF